VVAAVLLRSRETQVAKVCELNQRLSEHFWFEPKICLPVAKRDCLNIAADTLAHAPDILSRLSVAVSLCQQQEP
jgi:hypothetical protein